MKIEILGRQFEINDVKINEIFDNKYKKFKNCNINREEYVQCALDCFEYCFEEKFLRSLELSLLYAVGIMDEIASYKYFEKTPPYQKPWSELYPDRFPQNYLPSTPAQKYMEKLKMTLNRDEELLEKKNREEEEKWKKRYEEIDSHVPIEFKKSRNKKKQ